MTKLQKQAWFFLLIIFVVYPILIILGDFIYAKFTGKPLSIKSAAATFAPCILGIFIPLTMNASCIVRKPQQWKGVYPYDERDQLIHYKALLYVFYTLCVVFIAGQIIIPTLTFTQSIPSYILSLCFSGLAFLTVFVYSVAILIQYGWRGDGDK